MGNSAARRWARMETERLRRENYMKWWLNERLKDALWDHYMSIDLRARRTLESVAEWVTILHDEERQAEKEAQADETAAGATPE